MNKLAAEHYFGDAEPVATLPLDWESNEDNFSSVDRPEPAMQPVYIGMRAFLTKNFDKANDFVNGMACVVEAYHPEAKCIEVSTQTGKRLAAFLNTEHVDKRGRVTSFPLRLGYASTIQKLQGATLPHVTMWLDIPGCKAAGYVALSRIRRDNDYLIAGHVTRYHFRPAL